MTLKRIVLAQFLGILTIGILHLLLIFLNIFLFQTILMNDANILNSRENFESALSSSPYNYLGWATSTMRLLILVLGGFVTGAIAKDKGWLWGGFLGIFFVLFYFIIVLTSSSNLTPAHYLGLLLSSLPTILLTGLGGYLGKRFTFAKKQSRKR